jgi:HD-GYP domain-containing protein (c-di-GMP phosphodiesterase class II)
MPPMSAMMSAFVATAASRGRPVLIEEQKVEVDRLKVGMFVSRLDRDWAETPFLLQGFVIGSDDDIAQLRRYCAHVYIDVEKGIGDARLELSLLDDRGEPAPPPRIREPGAPYPVVASVTEEIPRAADAVERISASAVAIIDAFRAGDTVDHARVAAAVEPVVASLVRNPDAFFWLQALRKHGDYAYAHAVDCCALAVALGRQLGLPETVLRDIATGGLLMDIGMTSVPSALLLKPGSLTESERVAVCAHVGAGEALYRHSGMDHGTTLEMLLHHHERRDGSGYPCGLAGSDIPLYARIAGIVDTYDAMISPRPWRAALSRHDALQAMYRECGRLFQDELIEQFMQCLGVYPVGSLVELSSGEVAIVMAQNPTRRLRPVLMLLTDAAKRIRGHFEPLDLMIADRARLPQAALKIVRGLEAGAYGLEPTELYL